jgi:hypothetical protein
MQLEASDHRQGISLGLSREQNLNQLSIIGGAVSPCTAHLGSRNSFPGARGRLRLRPSTEMHMSSRRKEVLLPSAGNPWLPYLHSSVVNLVKVDCVFA